MVADTDALLTNLNKNATLYSNVLMMERPQLLEVMHQVVLVEMSSMLMLLLPRLMRMEMQEILLIKCTSR